MASTTHPPTGVARKSLSHPGQSPDSSDFFNLPTIDDPVCRSAKGSSCPEASLRIEETPCFVGSALKAITNHSDTAKMPGGSDERRKYRRYDLRIPCEFRVAGEPYRGFITDVSGGGFFIRSASKFEGGAEIIVTIEFDPGAPIVITGHVVRKRPTHRSIAAVSDPGLGVQIDSAPEAYYLFVYELEESA